MRISRKKFRAFFEIFVSRPIRSAKAREFGECVAGKMSARFGPFWPEPVLFGQPERTNGRRP